VCLEISKLDNEWHDTIIIVVNDELSEYNSVCAETSNISWPPFGSHNIWGVDNELVSISVESGCGHQTGNIRTVTDFSLGIGSQDFHLSAKWQPFLGLFFVSHIL
jgi:hypothetical protein